MMEGLSNENVFNILHKEMVDLEKFDHKNEQEIENNLQENLDFLRRMVSQVPGLNAGPLMPKTPKVNRKNPMLRIETIHEDELVEFESTRETSIIAEEVQSNVENNDEDDTTSNRRSRRTASKKAASSIKQQQSLSLVSRSTRSSQADRDKKKLKQELKETSSSSEDEFYRPVRQSKTRKPSIQKTNGEKHAAPDKKTNSTFVLEIASHKERSEALEQKERVSTSKRKLDETRSPSPQQSSAQRHSRTRSGEPAAKKANLIDESLEKSSLEDTLESSIYEDAIGRPAPIHNSTKIIDTTVTLESKSSTSNPKARDSSNSLKTANNVNMNVTVVLESLSKRTKTLAVPEQERLEDEDVVGCTPEVKNLTKNTYQQGYRAKVPKPGKNSHKANALFSPYATDSVKKRVEAFEQVGLNSPNPVEVDAPTRVTRTKTRAMAAAEASVNSAQSVQPVQSITQKLARKSLAKAKKISLAKQMKDTDEGKENENLPDAPMKLNRLLAINEKLMQKQQLKITPIGKSRLQQPMSVNRIPNTPSNVPLLSSHSKAMSASRTNIIINTDSFLPSSKQQANKLSLAEKIEEKRRKANEEDARRKRDEALKALIEEKKRKREEKELKNKLAREAKEKLDREKRLKAEKEREEKAKIALLIQEKQREEAERKRLLQLQRAQETEDRRKQEEQLRLQRLQEQEEMERQLAEQKRKEQEAAERQHQRRLAEAKAQQQAVAEAAKIKAQYQAKQGKYLNNTHTLQKQAQAPTSYKIESEPDEDDDASDNEDAPKHAVPTWANSQVRREQLALQKHIPSFEVHRYFNSRQCTPDLTEIFEAIDKRRLKRTSSAIWKTPPRYSMMYRE